MSFMYRLCLWIIFNLTPVYNTIAYYDNSHKLYWV